MDLPIEPLGCELPNCLASSDHYLALSVDADDEHLTGGVDDVGVQLVPVVRQDERKVLGVQRLVLVREAIGR